MEDQQYLLVVAGQDHLGVHVTIWSYTSSMSGQSAVHSEMAGDVLHQVPGRCRIVLRQARRGLGDVLVGVRIYIPRPPCSTAAASRLSASARCSSVLVTMQWIRAGAHTICGFFGRCF